MGNRRRSRGRRQLTRDEKKAYRREERKYRRPPPAAIITEGQIPQPALSGELRIDAVRVEDITSFKYSNPANTDQLTEKIESNYFPDRGLPPTPSNFLGGRGISIVPYAPN